MSFNVAMLKAMQAEGLSFEAAIRILEAGEGQTDTAAEKRRAWDRQRKRDKRETEKAVSTGHSTGNPPDGFPNDIDILTPSVPPNGISDEIPPPLAERREPELKPELLVEAWNTMAKQAGVHKARLTPERRKKINPFLRRHSVDDITEAIWAVPRSPFLCGQNDRGWKADLDFFLQPKSFTRILEGSYGSESIR